MRPLLPLACDGSPPAQLEIVRIHQSLTGSVCFIVQIDAVNTPEIWLHRAVTRGRTAKGQETRCTSVLQKHPYRLDSFYMEDYPSL